MRRWRAKGKDACIWLAKSAFGSHPRVRHPCQHAPMWYALQSTLFTLTMPLLLDCSSQIGRASVQMFTCQLQQNIQSNVWFYALSFSHSGFKTRSCRQCLFPTSDQEIALIRSFAFVLNCTICAIQHISVKLMELIVSIMNNSDTPMLWYKVKAHTGLAGDEFSDANIAKHATIHNDGHDEAFPSPSPSSEAFPLYILACRRESLQLP